VNVSGSLYANWCVESVLALAHVFVLVVELNCKVVMNPFSHVVAKVGPYQWFMKVLVLNGCF